MTTSLNQDEIFGFIERITFQNSDNGYTVAQLKQPRKRELTCIVGSIPTIQPGETLRCWGLWKHHVVYGSQFEVQRYSTEAPSDILGIKKYLGCGLIKGIGSTYAERIVELFGKDTLEIIDTTPEFLLEIKGIGKERLKKIKRCWSEQKSIREVMIFLQSYGVSPAFAQKIFKNYREESIQKLKENPFRLAKDISGIGFKTADTIATSMGFTKNAPQRIEAGIEYVLLKLSDEGNVCYPFDDFLVAAEAILQVDSEAIRNQIKDLEKERRIIVTDLFNNEEKVSFIWIKPLYLAELGISRQVSRIQNERSFLRAIDTPKALEWVQRRLHIKLAGNQQVAVSAALSDKMLIITGGPGTGKSTITKGILAITEKLTRKILLAAPTGRAAKRMTEITQRKAFTIHSLLEYDFKSRGFKRNRDSPLDCDLIIIDEASMIDTSLMNQLLKAIPDHARVILVGDINQLPSVGPGNVLNDMITSKQIPVSTLTEIYRQARGSRIVTNAHRINKGEFPYLKNFANGDFFFIEELEPEGVLNTIVSLVHKRLPRRYHFDPIEEIQVLAPMKRGVIGTYNLNASLQNALNPKGESLIHSGYQYRIHDKVMQMRNNYRKNVFNGDVGKIAKIDATDQQMTVIFDGVAVEYEFSDLDELTLAYAISIHKYQGSECPCVVMPIHTSHYRLLHRNLLYTGITRGKKLVVLVGSKKALAIAIHNDEVKKRYTGLQQALTGL